MCGVHAFSLARPLIMGIVNVTPDSFSDGGKFLRPDRAILQSRQLIDEGADLIDIGGESTRPGAAAVSLQEELDRVMPVLVALAREGVPVSVDTQKTEVMQEAIKQGVAMINDVNALQASGAVEICAASTVALCLMHKQGASGSMQQAPEYQNVVTEVRDFLLIRADVCRTAGIKSERIVIDPGFGFGKTTAHNFVLLRELNVLVQSGYTVLAGFSRKSSLGLITGRTANDRLAASLATALIAMQHGAKIIRVHDVKETVDVMKIWLATANAHL